jgi:hypothetical protein
MALGNPQPGDSVLDVACGTGLLTRIVAKAVGPNVLPRPSESSERDAESSHARWAPSLSPCGGPSPNVQATRSEGLWERHFGAAAAAGYYAQHSLDDPELALPLLRSAGLKKAFPRLRRGCSRQPNNCSSLRARHVTRPAAPPPENRLVDHSRRASHLDTFRLCSQDQ